MTTELDDRTEEIRLAGRVGFWALIALTIVLLVHPFGTTDLYDDGQLFLEHVDGLWIGVHFTAAVLFLALLLPLSAWARNLANPRARLLGRWAVLVGVVGTAVGLIHLTATDTTTFVAFAETFESGNGSEVVGLGADVLLRIHAATFVAWVASYFFALPAGLGMAVVADGRFPSWHVWLLWIAAALAAVSVVLTLIQGQLTTLSEMGIFRPSVTLLLIWMLVTTWWMRRGRLVKAIAG